MFALPAVTNYTLVSEQKVRRLKFEDSLSYVDEIFFGFKCNAG